MKIAICDINYPLETFLERLLIGLQHKGHDITIVSKNKPEKEWLENNQIDWVPLVYIAPWFCKVWLSFIQYVRGPWDVFYFPWNNSMNKYQECFSEDAKLVVSCRGSQLKMHPHVSGEEYVARLKKSFGRANAVHVVSEDMKREGCQYDLEENKGYVIHSGVNIEEFHPDRTEVSDPQNLIRIITVTSLISRKNIETTLIAMRILKDRGYSFQLKVIGNGNEQEMRYCIVDNQLQDDVEWIPHLNSEKIAEACRCSDIFMLSSICEGIPNSAMEAMASGLPVVLADIGGIHELVEDKVQGLIVSMLEPESFANALQTLMDDPELRARMGKQAREKIEKDFTLERYIGEFEKMLQKVIV